MGKVWPERVTAADLHWMAPTDDYHAQQLPEEWQLTSGGAVVDAVESPAVGQRASTLPGPIRGLLVVGLLYAFLIGVKLLEGGIKGLGSDFTDALFQGVSNPLAGLFVGVLATVLVQSSSVTTATIVGLVGTGLVSVEHAVPMIMGANIGTTVTNTIVSLAHMRQSEEFKRAFTAATMHDFFNLMVVAVLLPVEVLTKVLSNTAKAITEAVAGDIGGGKFNSPIKGAVKWGAQRVEDLFGWVDNEKAAAVVFLIVGIGLIFLTLTFITKNMRVLVADRIERSLNAALAKSGTVGIIVGMLVTIAVQSSSITTSILIPLVASGILLVRNAYPITLGANIGTTVTALIAALGIGEIDGLTIAVTHTVFNTLGILLVYPWEKIRYIPVTLAEKLADIALKRKSLALGYTLTMFVAVPLIGILVLR
jgi:sodium-dependent phosphate cotransporter